MRGTALMIQRASDAYLMPQTMMIGRRKCARS